MCYATPMPAPVDTMHVMRSCLILGSGRSGTSMTAGALAGSGYYMGDAYMAPASGNPRGYFEGRDVNDINERLLAQACPPAPLGPIGRRLWPRRFRWGQRWVARLPVAAAPPCPEHITRNIRAVAVRQPLCLKDPRFCYTLPCWRPHLPEDTAFICVFRHPAATAESIVRECAERPYLRNLKMDCAIALDVWTKMYQHVMRVHRHDGQWLFLHFDQVATGDGLDRLERFLDAPVDRDFPDRTLSRAAGAEELNVPAEALSLYSDLCEQAGFG